MSTTILSSQADPGPPTLINGLERSNRTIAVDMDDVLCQTNMTIVDMHHEFFGIDPPLTIDDFKNYLYWKNRGWGNPAETEEMVTKLYGAALYMKAPPVDGAKEGLLKLKEMGYNLVIITARSEGQRQGTEDWIEKYLPDIFDEIHFTGAFQHLEPTPEELSGHAAKQAIVSHHTRSKAEIVHSTGSILLIDDSAETALDAARADPPVKVLLFGKYPWNAIVHRPENSNELDELTYVERIRRGLVETGEERRNKLIREAWLPDGVERVADWADTVRWVGELESRRTSIM